MGAVNTNPDAINFMYRLRWYILGKNSLGALNQSKNCGEDESDKSTNPLEEHGKRQEVCLTAPLFASIVDTSITANRKNEVVTARHFQHFWTFQLSIITISLTFFSRQLIDVFDKAMTTQPEIS